MFNDKITKSIAEAAMKVMAASQGTTPKNEKERKLAALAAPKDKITHKDVMVGRGVVAKEEVQHINEVKLPDSKHHHFTVKSNFDTPKPDDENYRTDTIVHKGTVHHKHVNSPSKFEVHNRPTGLHWKTKHTPEEKKAIVGHLTKHKYFDEKDFVGKDPARIHEEVELEEGIEDRLEAARAKAKAAGKTINPPKKAVASTVRKVAGKAYGGAAQVDKPDDEDEEGEKPVKRGRGRPKGSTGRSFKSKLYKESFSELMDDLKSGGVKSLYENVVFEEIIEEEPDNEQFTKEVEQQKKKAAGTAGEAEKAKVAKASVQAVKNEGVEVEMFDADGVNGVQIEERELTPDETKKKEEVVKSMKKKMAGFKERYGNRAKEVMYATATKVAKGE